MNDEKLCPVNNHSISNWHDGFNEQGIQTRTKTCSTLQDSRSSLVARLVEEHSQIVSTLSIRRRFSGRPETLDLSDINELWWLHDIQVISHYFVVGFFMDLRYFPLSHVFDTELWS